MEVYHKQRKKNSGYARCKVSPILLGLILRSHYFINSAINKG